MRKRDRTAKARLGRPKLLESARIINLHIDEETSLRIDQVVQKGQLKSRAAVIRAALSDYLKK